MSAVAEIFVGVQTSADDVYIVRAQTDTAITVTFRWNKATWTVEKAILRPCLHDVELQAFARPKANKWMIFPYRLVTGASRTEAQVIRPDEMRRDFPGAFAYLSARRAELNERNITGGAAAERQFYQFGRSQSLTKFDSEKIILPALSVEPRYAYDDANIVVTGGGNGPYYLLRPCVGAGLTNFYLLAVLNHPLSEAFIRTNTSPFRGGYYSHGKQFIERLPIPMLADPDRAAIDDLVRDLLAAHQALAAARTPHQQELQQRQIADLRRQVETGVSAAFGLSNAEIEVARAVPIPA